MQYKRYTTIALALAAIATAQAVSAKQNKPFVSRNRSGLAICRNIGVAPKLTVCVSGKPGSGRVSDAAIKSAALSIKKMALIYGAKYSTLSSSQVAKFSTLSCGDEAPVEAEVSSSSEDAAPVVEDVSDSSEEYVDLMSQAEAPEDEMPAEAAAESSSVEEPVVVEAAVESSSVEEPVIEEAVAESSSVEEPVVEEAAVSSRVAASSTPSSAVLDSTSDDMTDSSDDMTDGSGDDMTDGSGDDMSSGYYNPSLYSLYSDDMS